MSAFSKRHGVAAGIASLLLSVPAFAQEAAPSAPQGAQPQAQESAQKPKDYGAGFEKFFKLGLQDVSGAKYVKLDVFSSGFFDPAFYMQELSGNAWLLKEDKAAKSSFALRGGRAFEIYDNAALMKIKQKEMEAKLKEGKLKPGRSFSFDFDSDGKMAGQWRDADFKKDLAKMLKLLSSSRSNKRDFARDNSLGAFLLTAAQAYKMGLKDEGNQLAAAVFETAGSPQKAIAQAMSSLADAQCNAALDKFFEDGDWNGLAKGLDSLLATFSSGWRLAPAVKKLSAEVKARAAQTAVPELKGEGLSDEDRKLALEMASIDVSNSSGLQKLFLQGGRNWLLRDAKAKPAGSGDQGVVGKIMDGGMKSVPLLIAMLKDGYMLKLDSQKASRHFVSYDSGDSGEDAVERRYRSMRRPATRGDLAAILLSPILPKDDSSPDAGPEALEEKASAWYAQNKAKSPSELARLYMAEGDSQQKSEAVSFLIRSGTEKDFADMEAILLDGEADDYFILQAARDYAMKRGASAKPFVEKFIKKLNDTPAEEDYEKRQIKETVAALNEAVSSRGAKEILDDIASGAKKFEESSNVLMGKLKAQKRGEAVKLLLSAAIAAKKPEDSVKLMAFIRMLGVPSSPEDMEEGGDESAEGDSLKDNAALWKSLLADSRRIKGYGGAVPISVGDVAASMIEMLSMMNGGPAAGAGLASRQKALSGLDSKKLMDIVKARALKILDGAKEEELPKYPSTENVGAERKKKLLEDFKAQGDGAAARKLCSSFSDDELLVLIDEADKDDSIVAKFGQEANTVRKIGSDEQGLDSLKDLEAFKGKPLDKAMLEAVFAVAKRLGVEGKGAILELTRGQSFEGVEIKLSKMLPDSDESKLAQGMRGSQKAGEPAVVGLLAAPPGLMASSTWTFEAEKKAEKKKDGDALDAAVGELDGEVNDIMSQRRQDFWKKAEGFCAGKGNVLRGALIRFYAVPAKKDEASSGAKAE